MTTIEQLAVAVLSGEQLEARAMARELVARGDLATLPRPSPALAGRVIIMSAALAELLADYASVQPPLMDPSRGRDVGPGRSAASDGRFAPASIGR